MSVKEIASKLVALCKEGTNQEAVETLYAEDIVSVEAADSPGFPRTMNGLAAIKGKNKWWAENHEIHGGDVEGPFPHGDDKFAVIFKYDVTMKEANQRMNLHEIAVYTVTDGKISREEFYYAMGA